MSVATEHMLIETLSRAARGEFPAGDGRAEAVGELHGTCDVLAAFAHHVVVAADVSQSWVNQHYSDDTGRRGEDPSSGVVNLISALATELGNPPMAVSLLMAAPPKSGYLSGKITEGGEPDPGWAAYRTDIRTYQYESTGSAGAFAIGRGPGDRWEVFFRVDHGPGGRVGRELLSAAKTVTPERGVLFGSTPLHDPRIIRIASASGFLPICTEVLFLTRPRGR
jgi:hypothetical protein